MLSKSKAIVSSHRDAATRVAKYLRDAHGVELTPIAGLEIIARALGAANWQVLHAMAQQGRTPRPGDAAISGLPHSLPFIGAEKPLNSLQGYAADMPDLKGDRPGTSIPEMADVHEVPVRAVGAFDLRSGDESVPKEYAASGSAWYSTQKANLLERPSQVSDARSFLFSPGFERFASTTQTGKWCVMCDGAAVDALWLKVCSEIQGGTLHVAMASTAKRALYHGGSYVICIFTRDWSDKEDVMRVRQILRDLGVTDEIRYKRDIETLNHVYGVPEEWYYHA